MTQWAPVPGLLADRHWSLREYSAADRSERLLGEIVEYRGRHWWRAYVYTAEGVKSLDGRAKNRSDAVLCVERACGLRTLSAAE